jgi:lipoprotein-releasing system permease protein
VATGIEVRIEQFDRSLAMAALIQERLGGAYWVRDWSEMNNALFSAIRLEKLAMFVILTLIVLVASFSIVGSLIMKVIEKGKDIAILKSWRDARPGQARLRVRGFHRLGRHPAGVARPGYLLALERQQFILLPTALLHRHPAGRGRPGAEP